MHNDEPSGVSRRGDSICNRLGIFVLVGTE